MFDIKEVLVETTPELLPHTYYLGTDGKLVAFKRAGEQDITYYTRPLKFSKSKRKFKKVKL